MKNKFVWGFVIFALVALALGYCQISALFDVCGLEECGEELAYKYPDYVIQAANHGMMLDLFQMGHGRSWCLAK